MSEGVIEVKDLSVAINGNLALERVSFSLEEGQIVGIIGPNGAGKTTLLKTLLGLINPLQGTVKVRGRPICQGLDIVAYVPQRHTIDLNFPVLVEEVVMMGRFPHLAWWERPKARDRRIVEESLRQTGMLPYRKRQIGQLSGGQQQRVFVARALAQEADIYLMDEPFVGIDITSEEMIIALLRQLRSQGRTMLVVHHDLSKAPDYFDNMLLLNQQLVAQGTWEEVFKEDNLRSAYQDWACLYEGHKELMVVNS